MQFIDEQGRTRLRNTFPARAGLAAVIRRIARDLENRMCGVEVRDEIDLIRILANVLEGRDAVNALGAPGDWGYSSDMGKALAAAIKENNRLGPIVLAVRNGR